MPSEEPLSKIEYLIREYPARKETCLVKFINGFETTSVVTRFKWPKHGRQGAWERCAKHELHSKKA